MKILLVSEPGVDGVFRYVEALAHYLVAQDVEVHLAYSDRRGSEALVRLIGFVQEHGGATLNLAVGNRPSPRADWRALRALHALVRQIQPDLIHSHSSKAGALARALRLFGIRLPQIYHPHAYAGMRPQSMTLRLFYDGLESVFGRFCTTINCSEDEYDYARHRLRLPARRCITVINGIDTLHFTPPSKEQKLALRRAFGLPPAAPILGALGRSTPQKDPLTLYRAFARALEADPGLVLFHIGSGELDRKLQQFVRQRGLQGRIIRRAYISTPIDFYRTVDGFILPSLYEGLALAALEAMSCDLPLILSDAPGNRHLIKRPFSHLWSAPIGDDKALARAMVDWAGVHRTAPAGRISNHRLIARKNFDHRASLDRILTLYHRQVARARNQPVGWLRRSHTGRPDNPQAQPSAALSTTRWTRYPPD